MRYKLYDISLAGDKMDTGKTLDMNAISEAVKEVFKLFGWNQYIESYRVKPDGNNAYITYPYVDGVRDTWFVERIIE